MQRSLFRFVLASFFSMAVSVALSADLSKGSYNATFPAGDQIGCSCDAPGIFGRFCATAGRCEEMSGVCLGRCVDVASDRTGCACAAPGIFRQFCATPGRCVEMSGLCLGRC